MTPVLASFIFLLLSPGECSNTTPILVRKGEREPIFEYSSRDSFLPEVSLEGKAILHFVLDFAVRSEWDQIVMLVSANSAMLEIHAVAISEFFNGHGKYISIHSTQHSLLPQSLYHNRHRVGVVLVWEPNMDTFFDELKGLDVFNEYRSWLFIRREEYKGMNMTKKLSDLTFGIDTNAVICKVERQPIPTKSPVTKTTTEYDESSYYEIGEKVCVPENQKEHWYEGICITGSALPSRIKRETGEPQIVINMHQIYKLPGAEARELRKVYLGFWDIANRLGNSERPVPIEKRLGNHPFRIRIGTRNSTFDGIVLPATAFTVESDEDEEVHMKEVLECLFYGLNASRESFQFAKLGWRNEEGGWTHMLGAVVEGTIDFALDTISVNMDQLQEMSLTYPIVKTMNNIYFRRPDSGGMRDIFLAPFSPNLLICVFSTAILLAFAMISITVIKFRISSEGEFNEKSQILREVKREVKVEAEERKWEVSEAALWSVSVMCMQGSPWCPSSKSGSFLLICGLLFALVIYNAYAAFITSVLSVKTVRIKNLIDLINSDFAFGYTLGNTDELFLRTVNNSLLRELYFKGLRENDGVKDPIAGMHRAAEGDYAFFVAARTARRALRREVAHNRRCGIQELALPVTRTVAAIPMSRRSPFKKIINFRVLRMMESGVLHRFQSLILPPMPKCVEKTTFNSARFTDVYSAFYMIVSGWAISLILLLGEIVWHKRKHGPKEVKKRDSENDASKGHHASISSIIHDFHWPRRMHN